MFATILTLLAKPLQWLTKNPKIALALLLVGAFTYGWHERSRALLAERAATKATTALTAMTDTTKLYRGMYSRTVVQLDSLPAVLAAKYAALAKGEKPVAGVVITTKERVATAIPEPVVVSPSTDPAKPDTVSSQIDTLGVHAGVRIMGPLALWNVVRHPTTLTLEFVRMAHDSLVARARSSDGAALDLSPPFLIQPDQPLSVTRHGATFWAMLAGDAVLLAKLLVGLFQH